MGSLTNDSGLFTKSEFQSRGIIKLAPDVLVYIGGHLTSSVIAPVSSTNQSVSFNDGITTVSIQNNIDPPGSSNASIEITAPIYNENSKYWMTFKSGGKSYRTPIFLPMMEIKIFFKGRFLIDMQPRYYPAFWGIVTGVEENYSGGTYKITLSCADMLHWWSYVQVNVHPVPASNIAIGGGQTMTPYQTIFKDANPFTILWRLTNDMYVPHDKEEDVNKAFEENAVHMIVGPGWLAQLNSLRSIYPPEFLKKTALGIMSYWRERFGNLAALLKMYGANGEKVTVTDRTGRKLSILKWKRERQVPWQSNSDKKKAAFYANVREFDVSESLRNFTVFFEYDKMSDFHDAEYMSKLDIATEVKNRVEYEFFQDVDGNFIFKPPFYNLNTKYVEPYVIRPNDIINNSFHIDAEGIVTVLQVKTPFFGQLRSLELPNKVGFHIDIDLAQRYGLRFKEMPLQYIQSSADIAAALAVGHMAMINSKCYTGSVTIPGRPEMRLGYPIYIAHRDSFHYVKSINHSFDYGGSFTTTLSLEAERKRMYDFSQPDTPVMIRKIYKFKEAATPADSHMSATDLKNMKLAQDQKKLQSIAQGRYEIVTQESEIESSVTNKTVPFTDEEGYKVIGSFRYGRGIIATGGTRMDDVDFKSATDSALRLQQVKNDIMTTMVPASSEQESQLMSMFFNRIPENEDGIIPKYVNLSQGIDASEEHVTVSEDKTNGVVNINPKGFWVSPLTEITAQNKLVNQIVPITGTD